MKFRAAAALVPLIAAFTVIGSPAADAVDTDVAIDTTSIDFGDVNVGSSSVMSVTVTNTGDDPFGPINMFGGEPPTAEFSGSQNCQGVMLAPGGSCSVSYTFSPSAPGAFSDTSSFTISETANQADGENFTVSLAGNGVTPAAATTTTLQSSVNPSIFGQSVTFTATVDAASVPDVPTGSVTFVDTTTATTLGTVTLDAGGQATFTTSALAVGSHAIQATYTPDSASFSGSTDSLTQVVNPVPTTIALSSSPNPSTLGQAVTLTADVTAVSPSQGSPTGSVTVVDLTTGETLGTATVHSQATLTINGLAVGTHVLRVTFTPDTANFTSSAADITHTVLAPAASTRRGLPTLGPAVPVVGVVRFTG